MYILGVCAGVGAGPQQVAAGHGSGGSGSGGIGVESQSDSDVDMLGAEEAKQQARADVTRDAGCQVDCDGDVAMGGGVATGQSEDNASSDCSESDSTDSDDDNFGMEHPLHGVEGVAPVLHPTVPVLSGQRLAEFDALKNRGSSGEREDYAACILGLFTPHLRTRVDLLHGCSGVGSDTPLWDALLALDRGECESQLWHGAQRIRDNMQAYFVAQRGARVRAKLRREEDEAAIATAKASGATVVSHRNGVVRDVEVAAHEAHVQAVLAALGDDGGAIGEAAYGTEEGLWDSGVALSYDAVADLVPAVRGQRIEELADTFTPPYVRELLAKWEAACVAATARIGHSAVAGPSIAPGDAVVSGNEASEPKLEFISIVSAFEGLPEVASCHGLQHLVDAAGTALERYGEDTGRGVEYPDVPRLDAYMEGLCVEQRAAVLLAAAGHFDAVLAATDNATRTTEAFRAVSAVVSAVLPKEAIEEANRVASERQRQTPSRADVPGMVDGPTQYRRTPLRMLVTGGGGCGKSRVLQQFVKFAKAFNAAHAGTEECGVLVTATTGAASANIGYVECGVARCMSRGLLCSPERGIADPARSGVPATSRLIHSTTVG